ncbi:hypothetical protein MRX96_058766 [Rhipicephalus microplus]
MPLARLRGCLCGGGDWPWRCLGFRHGRLSRNCSDDARAQRNAACQPCEDVTLYRVAGALGRASYSVRDGFTNVSRHFHVTPVVRRTRAAGKPIASLVKKWPCSGLRAHLVGRALAVVQEVDGSECIRCRPQIRRDNPLNLSISLSGGKETNRDSPSSCERNGTEPSIRIPRPCRRSGNGVYGRRLSRVFATVQVPLTGACPRVGARPVSAIARPGRSLPKVEKNFEERVQEYVKPLRVKRVGPRSSKAVGFSLRTITEPAASGERSPSRGLFRLLARRRGLRGAHFPPPVGRRDGRRVKGNQHDFESGSGGDLSVSSETARGSYTTPCTKSSSPRPGPMGFSRLSGGPKDDALRKRSGEPAGQACRLLLSALVPRRRVGWREASASGAILPRRRYRGLRRVGR